MNSPFLFPLIGLSSGIFIAYEFSPEVFYPLYAIGVGLIIWLVIHYLSRNPIKSFALSKWHPVWIILIFSGVGAFLMQSRSTFIEEDISKGKFHFKGKVESYRSLAKGDNFILEIKSIYDENLKKINFRNLKVILVTDGFSACEGDILEIYEKPEAFSRDKKNERDFDNYYLEKGINYKLISKTDRILKTEKEMNLSVWFSSIKYKIIEKIEKSSLSRETTGFLIPILTGDKYFLPTETRETFSEAGLSHILALSGLHVGIILTIFLFLFYPLSFYGLNFFRQIIAILLLWIYVGLTGCAPATVRAAIMASFIICALVLQRKNSSINSLFAAVFLILLINPYNFWDIGLQLSFLSVSSILLFVNKLNPIEKHNHPFVHKIIDLVLISICAFIATLALSVYYFKNISLSFIPTNLILLPLLPGFILLCIGYVVFLTLGFDPVPLARIIDRFYNFFLETASSLSWHGDSIIHFSIDKYSVFWWIMALCGITILIYSKKKNMRLVGLLTGVISLGFSLFLIIINNEGINKDSIIFHHSFTKLEASLKTQDSAKRLIFPRSAISKTQFKNMEILSIDASFTSEALRREKNGERRKFLLIGPGADLSQIAELMETGFFEMAVMHPNFGKRMMEEFFEGLDPAFHDNIYSLGESGSLEFPL